MTATVRRLTEAECQSTIIAAAKQGGWLVHHTRPSLNKSGRWGTAIQGDRGFPDLILGHHRRGVFAVELKRKPNRVDGAQRLWLDVLTLGGVEAEVWWMPDELDERCRWLVGG